MKKLYRKTVTGDIQSWEISVTEDTENGYGIITVSTVNNIDLKDPKTTVRTTTVKSGKNIGKSNETTAYEQAEKEALAKWIKKQEREEYQLSIDAAKNFVSERPMLAQKYEDKKKTVNWDTGVFGQAKLNGIRCTVRKTLADTLVFTSREGMDYTPVLSKHLVLIKHLHLFMNAGDDLDGELYVPGWELNRIGAAVKKYRKDTLKLQYHVFDLRNRTDVFAKRYEKLIEIANRPEGIITEEPMVYFLSCFLLKSEDQMFKLHDNFVKEGHEGIIIRNPYALYTYFYRVPDLLKYKKFIDEEFAIVDTYCETQEVNGTEKELICFVCETDSGETFKVQPKGTHSMREDWWKKRESFIGKQLTVRFQEWSGIEGGAKNVPVFPKGVVVRDYE